MCASGGRADAKSCSLPLFFALAQTAEMRFPFISAQLMVKRQAGKHWTLSRRLELGPSYPDGQHSSGRNEIPRLVDTAASRREALPMARGREPLEQTGAVRAEPDAGDPGISGPLVFVDGSPSSLDRLKSGLLTPSLTPALTPFCGPVLAVSAPSTTGWWRPLCVFRCGYRVTEV